MATSRLVEAGIHTKMIRDSQAILKLPSYWTAPKGRKNEPLFLLHVTLSFILCMVGLALATIAFTFEIALYKFKIDSNLNFSR